MRFDIKYPTSFPGDEPEAGLVRIDKCEPCENCGVRTDFMDMGSLFYICGDSCRKAIFKRYVEAANGE